jgi:hypothetical protein
MWFPLVWPLYKYQVRKIKLRSFLALKSLQLPVASCLIGSSFLIISTSPSETNFHPSNETEKWMKITKPRRLTWLLEVRRYVQHRTHPSRLEPLWIFLTSGMLYICATITFSVRMFKLWVWYVTQKRRPLMLILMEHISPVLLPPNQKTVEQTDMQKESVTVHLSISYI